MYVDICGTEHLRVSSDVPRVVFLRFSSFLFLLVRFPLATLICFSLDTRDIFYFSETRARKKYHLSQDKEKQNVKNKR